MQFSFSASPSMFHCRSDAVSVLDSVLDAALFQFAVEHVPTECSRGSDGVQPGVRQIIILCSNMKVTGGVSQSNSHTRSTISDGIHESDSEVGPPQGQFS